MENVMERTNALKWFWPFMIVAALAGATIVALPQFAARDAASEPQFRMLMTVTAQRPQVADVIHVSDTMPAAIERYCIEVKAKRPSFIQRLAGVFSHGQSS
jgi:hypothetical protein